MKPAVRAPEARKVGGSCRPTAYLLDLQLILEFPGNLPVNYDNLPIIYRLPVN